MAEYSTDERFGAAEEAHGGSLAGWLGAGRFVDAFGWHYDLGLPGGDAGCKRYPPWCAQCRIRCGLPRLHPGGTPAENQGFSVNSVGG